MKKKEINFVLFNLFSWVLALPQVVLLFQALQTHRTTTLAPLVHSWESPARLISFRSMRAVSRFPVFLAPLGHLPLQLRPLGNQLVDDALLVLCDDGVALGPLQRHLFAQLTNHSLLVVVLLLTQPRLSLLGAPELVDQASVPLGQIAKLRAL